MTRGSVFLITFGKMQIHLSFAQTAALERGVQKRGVTAASAYFFPRDFVEAPLEKLPVGASLPRIFPRGRAGVFHRFSSKFGDFLEPGGAFGNLGGQPGPKTSIFDEF